MIFYEKLAKVYEHVFPTGFKPDFLSNQFSSATRLLDVGCSDGRVAKLLTEKGFYVHGIDLSSDMIAVAKAVAENVNNLDIEYLNMLEIGNHFNAKSFDGVYCIGNTLVHLKDKEEIRNALLGFSSVLAAEGKLVIQVINYGHVFSSQLKKLPLIENEYVKFEREYVLTPPEVLFKTRLEIKKTNEAYEAQTTLLGLDKNELEQLLSEAGFYNFKWFGDYKETPLAPTSLQMIVVCNKQT